MNAFRRADSGLVVPDQPLWDAAQLTEIEDHMPRSRSGVVCDDNVSVVMNRENEDTTTNTGGDPIWPAPSGIFTGGSHRSHCA